MRDFTGSQLQLREKGRAMKEAFRRAQLNPELQKLIELQDWKAWSDALRAHYQLDRTQVRQDSMRLQRSSQGSIFSLKKFSPIGSLAFLLIDDNVTIILCWPDRNNHVRFRQLWHRLTFSMSALQVEGFLASYDSWATRMKENKARQEAMGVGPRGK